MKRTFNMNTVHNLRKQGHKVIVTHERIGYKYNAATGRKIEQYYVVGKKYNTIPQGMFLSPKGGRTLITINFVHGKNLTTMAKCRKNEHYNRKLGVTVALNSLEKDITNMLNDVNEKHFDIMNSARIKQSLPFA